MNTEAFREYSARLSMLYARYFATMREAFFPAAPRSARTRPDHPVQRWEDEGGKTK